MQDQAPLRGSTSLLFYFLGQNFKCKRIADNSKQTAIIYSRCFLDFKVEKAPTVVKIVFPIALMIFPMFQSCFL